MIKILLKSFMMVILFVITSCNFKDPGDDSKKRMDEIAENQNKKLEEILKALPEERHNNLKLSFTLGGQPGLISITGVVVSDENILNQKISTLVLGGVGKDGIPAIVAEENKPIYKTEVKSEITNDFSNDKSIISFGCGEKQLDEYAKKLNLEPKNLETEDKNEDQDVDHLVAVIRANTIILCKDAAELPLKLFKIFMADHLILDGVNYTFNNNFGSLSFIANRLTLIGDNFITTRGQTNSMTAMLSSSPINLTVLKEFTPEENGKLLLMSFGSDYAPDEEVKK